MSFSLPTLPFKTTFVAYERSKMDQYSCAL
jgi:hypothetical protein